MSLGRSVRDLLGRDLLGRDLLGRSAAQHVSLGSHCHMAQVLKTLRLRAWSGPFDWLFSAPGMVRECLEDDFATLLDRTQLRSVPLAERLGPDITRCRHLAYGERYGIPFVFNHHDPDAVEADRRWFETAVGRLREVLREGRENRFWLLDTVPRQRDEYPRLCDVLTRSPVPFRLTVIQVLPDHGEASVHSLESGRDDLALFELATRSASAGVRFADPRDDGLLADLVRAEAERPLRERAGRLR